MFITLNRFIQENILGWTEFKPDFDPIVNMNDAMIIEEEMYEKGHQILLRRCVGDDCWIIKEYGFKVEGYFFCNVSGHKVVARTPQLAIIYASLLALGIDIWTTDFIKVD